MPKISNSKAREFVQVCAPFTGSNTFAGNQWDLRGVLIRLSLSAIRLRER
jgi:hypothetical protein